MLFVVSDPDRVKEVSYVEGRSRRILVVGMFVTSRIRREGADKHPLGSLSLPSNLRLRDRVTRDSNGRMRRLFHWESLIVNVPSDLNLFEYGTTSSMKTLSKKGEECLVRGTSRAHHGGPLSQNARLSSDGTTRSQGSQKTHAHGCCPIVLFPITRAY